MLQANAFNLPRTCPGLKTRNQKPETKNEKLKTNFQLPTSNFYLHQKRETKNEKRKTRNQKPTIPGSAIPNSLLPDRPLSRGDQGSEIEYLTEGYIIY